MLGSSLVVVVALCCAGGGDSVPGAAKHRDVFPRGVAVEIGLGRTSHRDEFISPERYSGSLPYVGARWSRWHGDHGYEVHLAFRGSGDVSNYTVSSDVVHFGLGQGFLYPAGTVRLLAKDAYLFLGPATDLHVFTNEQRIAVRVPNFATSAAVLVSLGATSALVMPLRPGVSLEGGARVALLSLGVRPVDAEVRDEPAAKLLTPLSGTDAALRLGVRAQLGHGLSVRVSYGFSLLRMTSWDTLLCATDDLALAVAWAL